MQLQPDWFSPGRSRNSVCTSVREFNLPSEHFGGWIVAPLSGGNPRALAEWVLRRNNKGQRVATVNKRLVPHLGVACRQPSQLSQCQWRLIEAWGGGGRRASCNAQLPWEMRPKILSLFPDLKHRRVLVRVSITSSSEQADRLTFLLVACELKADAGDINSSVLVLRPTCDVVKSYKSWLQPAGQAVWQLSRHHDVLLDVMILQARLGKQLKRI